MSDTAPEIQLIPVTKINVLNPRVRNKRIFGELVASIAALGIKKPITVRRRPEEDGYDLVCGQGRLEAMQELGAEAIPALVIDATQEDCFVMSLVENLARRQHTPHELVRQIGVLRERGYSIAEIARKTGFSSEYVWSICDLIEHGEARLLAAVERGTIPHNIAIEIVRAKDGDLQTALIEAYESKAMPGSQVLAIRRIVDERTRLGKGGVTALGGQRRKEPVTASALVRTYRKETQRQKLLVKKAMVAQERLAFMENALRKLLGDERFPLLLRAEGLHTMPETLSKRILAARA